MSEEKKEEKEIKERYSLAEIPTQTAIVIQDNEEKDEKGEPILHSGESILLEILNKVNKIEKAVA